MKKCFCQIATLVGLLPLLSLTALGAQQGNFVYYDNGSGGAVVESYVGPGGALVIPGSLGGLPVKTIGDSAFINLTNLTSITIPNSVTIIGEEAFAGCTGLTSLTLPNSLTYLASHLFGNCTGLTNVTIGNSVTVIGENTFDYCTGLTSLTIPNSVTTIGENAFGHSGLTSITIPNSLTYLMNNLFENCTNLTNVVLGNSVTGIGHKAFQGCSGLRSLTIPSSVNGIDENAFQNCTSLTGLYFAGNAPGEGAGIFSGAPLVTVFYRAGTTGWGATYADRPTVLWGTLSVQHSGTTVFVSWPKAATDFVLEESTALGPPPAPAWTQIPAAIYQTNVTSIFVTQPAATGHKFFRLRQP